MAECIAVKAEHMSYRGKDYDSPFAVHAREHKKNHPGGKQDDITVIVAQVKLSDKSDRNFV